MLKVLLIDDEKAILDGLKMLIDWNQLGFEIVGAATDGEEGFRLAKELNPNIIITDIRMPNLSGLELITKLKSELYNAKIIILSGYNEFDYAKFALENEVFDYLCKPVSKEELSKVLLRLGEKIKSDSLQRSRYVELLNKADRLDVLTQENNLKKVFSGEETDKEKIKSIVQDCLPGIEMPVVVMALELDNTNIEGFNGEQDRPLLKFAIDNILNEIATNMEVGFLLSYDAKHSVLLFDMHASAEYREKAADFLDDVRQTINGQLGATVSIGVSDLCSSFENLHNAYVEAVEALKYNAYFGNNMVMFFEDIPSKMSKEHFFPITFENDLIANIHACNMANAATALGNLFNYMHTLKVPPFTVYSESISILFQLRRCCFEYRLAEISFFKEKHFSLDYYQGKSPEDIQNWLLNIISLIITAIQNKPTSPTVKMVESIKKFINENYATATRETIAAKFFVNISYLSQVFKQIEGITLIEFIVRVRIEKAKQLLKSSELMVQDVAQRVGYATSQYFSKVFEKQTGQTPSEYRKGFGGKQI
ncbi:MAG: response regulator [Firmicutes bacterium]|nr:response regulator [Bacillota bacterium]